MEGVVDAGNPAGAPPVGILLAAGAGRRMGQPKALVRDADGTSWLKRAVDSLTAAGCEPVIVVLGAEAERAARLLEQRSPSSPPVSHVEATDWASGMGASLRRGLTAAADDGSADRRRHAGRPARRRPRRRQRVCSRPSATTASGAGARGVRRHAGAPRRSSAATTGRRWSRQAVGDHGARDYLAAHAARSSSAATSPPAATSTHRATSHVP